MPLIFSVINHRGQTLKETISATFDRKGGTIGRSLKSDVVLPDPNRFISRRHAEIRYEDGCYYLKDNSLAGTYIRNKDIHLHDNFIRLEDGDKLEIGDYEIVVHLQNIDTAESGAPSHMDNEAPISLFGFDKKKGCDPISGSETENAGEERVAWGATDIFDSSSDELPLKEERSPSPIHESFVPPDVKNGITKPSEIPSGFNFESLLSETQGKNSGISAPPQTADENSRSDQQRKAPYISFYRQEIKETNEKPATERGEKAPPQDNTPECIREPRQCSHEVFDLLMEAAGIENTDFYQVDNIPDIARTIGALLRELIEGLVAILRGRAELKSQIRVAGTLLGAADNNPLKFSPDIEETLKILLVKKQKGFTDAITAVRESHADIMSHQIAMTAGIQAAVKKLVRRFDPQRYSDRYKEGIVFQRKAKCWDAYREDYLKIVDEALDNFLGEEFSKAYEAQIRKFSSARNEH